MNAFRMVHLDWLLVVSAVLAGCGTIPAAAREHGAHDE